MLDRESLASLTRPQSLGQLGQELAVELLPDLPPRTARAVGVDLVDVERLRALGTRRGEEFLSRLFTERELADCRGTSGYIWNSLAGRFAAKEATLKTLTSCANTVSWTEIEVRRGESGEPELLLHGQARAAAERRGFTRMLLSISHDANLAITVVVAL